MSLAIGIEERMPGYYLVTLGGRLDNNTHGACEEKIRPLLVADTQAIMFDLSALDYISSMGLRVILKTRKEILGKGGSVHFVNMQPQIEKVFEIVNMLKGMTLFASVEEADAYFDAMQKKTLESG
ncbi:MAG: STAS domain-containing protein [Pseudomonadota bacterium]|nr:STAS domain-containing protein [Pseudomonadota bacterium]